MNDFSQISQIAVISDAEAGGLVSDRTHAELIAQITGRRERRPAPIARRIAIAAPVAAGLAVAAIVAASAGGPGQHAVPRITRPVHAEVLSFTRQGGYIDVIVRDPLADEKKYNAEFKAHGLDIRLSLVPASPSIVGTVVYFQGSSAIKTITARGRCFTGGGGSACPVGLRVPVDYHGAAVLIFGRAARPGERFESTTSATSPGEVLHGLRITGRQVSAVLAMLRARHVTAAEYQFVTAKHGGVLAHRVPGTWFVYDADPWAPGQVLLFVGKTRHQEWSSGQPAGGKPAPTASPGR